MSRLLMLPVILVALSLFAQHPPDGPDGEACRWHPEVQTDAGFSDSGSVDMSQGQCLNIDPSSVVWLESEGCECVVDSRIRATFQLCDGSPFDPTSLAGGCDTYHFGYSIIGVSSSSGNVMGDYLAGTATRGFPPPPVMYEDRVEIDCGARFTMSIESECSCVRTVTRRHRVVDQVTQETNEYPGIIVVPVVTEITYTDHEVYCEGSDRHVLFSASCVEDCNAAYPPDPIVVEVADTP